jgi:isoleucyl-tRNA synthetase
VLSAIELERKQGNIGKGLGARVEIRANETDAAFLRSFSKDSLAEFFNVSAIEISVSTVEIYAAREVNLDGTPAPPAATASIATGTKCNRCWRYTDDTANYGIWTNVCTRCQSALRDMGIAPPQTDGQQPEARQ